ncbi:MAG TPA: thioredoxin family protein, partial [Cellulomonas sp.]
MTSEPTAARPATVATALAAPAVAEVALDAELLRHPLGAAATFLQFSSGFCAPCRATRRVLERVVATSEGVAHVEVDVAHRGDLAGAFDVTVTPTVVVLDAHGVPV